MDDQLIQQTCESCGRACSSAPEIAHPKKGPREDFRGFCAICLQKDESISELLFRLLKDKQTDERAFQELREKLSKGHRGSDANHSGGPSDH